MDKEFKNISLLATDEIEGKVEAVFSIFNEIDSDGDVVLPNSIKVDMGIEELLWFGVMIGKM